MMRRFLGLVFWILATPVFAQENAIEGVIGSQLEAFNDRDVADAWQYAAPNIQGMFGTAENFGMMVERGYPMVWTNRDVQFLDQQESGAVTRQVVRLTDTNGGFHFLEYQMVPTDTGWRIAGVQIIPQPDVGV